MFKATRNNLGFSLVEVMIAAGILGVISLGVMKVTEMQSKSARTMDNKLSEGEIFRRITTNLADSEACVNTLTNIATQKEIKNKNGSRLYKVGDKVDHLLVKDITTNSVTGSGNRTVIITVTLERVGQNAGVKIIRKAFTIDAKYESGVVKSCYLDKENLVSTALAEVQKGLQEGFIKFEKLNIESPDGKTAIKIVPSEKKDEPAKIVLKGDIRIEDTEGNEIPLTEYVVSKIGEQLLPKNLDETTKTQDAEKCPRKTFASTKSVPYQICDPVWDIFKQCHYKDPAPLLQCKCNAIAPESNHGVERTISCTSSSTAKADTACIKKGGGKGHKATCSINNWVNKPAPKKTISCPTYIQKVKCVSGVWIKQ